MFPVRYELNSYINLLRNSVFKGLIEQHVNFKIYYKRSVRRNLDYFINSDFCRKRFLSAYCLFLFFPIL
jgi:hypothetical protein